MRATHQPSCYGNSRAPLPAAEHLSLDPAADPTATAVARGTPDALHAAVAIGSAPRNPREERELVAGIVLGLLCALATLVIVLFATGALELPRSTLPTYPPEISEARPTPQWPFRDEWLTPRPKG